MGGRVHEHGLDRRGRLAVRVRVPPDVLARERVAVPATIELVEHHAPAGDRVAEVVPVDHVLAAPAGHVVQGPVDTQRGKAGSGACLVRQRDQLGFGGRVVGPRSPRCDPPREERQRADREGDGEGRREEPTREGAGAGRSRTHGTRTVGACLARRHTSNVPERTAGCTGTRSSPGAVASRDRRTRSGPARAGDRRRPTGKPPPLYSCRPARADRASRGRGRRGRWWP